MRWSATTNQASRRASVLGHVESEHVRGLTASGSPSQASGSLERIFVSFQRALCVRSSVSTHPISSVIGVEHGLAEAGDI